MTFNFDYWKDAYLKDPKNFQNKKKEFLYKWIEDHVQEKNQASLKQLVDNLCVECKGTPQESAVSAFNLMLESLDSLKENLVKLQTALSNEEICSEESFYKYKAVIKKNT